jgi:hypothetical protein
MGSHEISHSAALDQATEGNPFEESPNTGQLSFAGERYRLSGN